MMSSLLRIVCYKLTSMKTGAKFMKPHKSTPQEKLTLTSRNKTV